MRKIIRIIFSIIVSIILSIAIYYGFNANGLLIKFYGISALIVSSGSMNPELAIGDIIIIKEYDNYGVNDVITYKVDNSYLVTHRIIEKEGTTYKTKGDNNNTADKEIVLQEQIEGKVICNSKILRFMYENWILLILVIAIILILF